MGKNISKKERFAGAMLGYAIGDAIGYNVKSLSVEQIKSKYGKKGFTKPSSLKVSDETQLMLFTSHGLLWANAAKSRGKAAEYERFVFLSYQMWLYTQLGGTASESYEWILDENKTGFTCPLVANNNLQKKRNPTKALVQTLADTDNMAFGTPNNRINSSEIFDCLPRCLPCGLVFRNDPEKAFEYGSKVAAITHGSPKGFLAAGAYSAIIAMIIGGCTIEESAAKAVDMLSEYSDGSKCAGLLRSALELVEGDTPPMDAVAALGSGDTAASALAIGIYCASAHYRYDNTVLLAANQDGNSDACAAVAGSIKGAYRGCKAIPAKWTDAVQFSRELKEYAALLLKASKKA